MQFLNFIITLALAGVAVAAPAADLDMPTPFLEKVRLLHTEIRKLQL